MHVTTTGRALAAAITAARKAVGRTPHGDRRAIIRRDGDAAYLVAADAETTYAEVIGEADPAAAPVQYVADLTTLPALKGAELVTITPAGITADGVTMPAAIADPDHLPAEREAGTATVTLEAEGSAAADVVAELHGVARAASRDAHGRAVLGVVLIADGYAAATDTYRLHAAEVPTDGDGSALIPEHVIRAIPTGVDYLYLAGDQAGGPVAAPDAGTFLVRWSAPPRGRTPRRTGYLTGYAIAGPYPRWRTLLPAEAELEGAPTITTTGTVKTAIGPAAKAGKAAGANTPVILGWQADAPGTVTAEAGGVAVALGTATTGTGSIAFNPAYLADLDGYLGAGGELVVRDGLKATIGTNGGRTALLMPMRVS